MVLVLARKDKTQEQGMPVDLKNFKEGESALRNNKILFTDFRRKNNLKNNYSSLPL